MNRFDTLRDSALTKWDHLVNGQRPLIYVGNASCGRAAGSLDLLNDIQAILQENNITATVIQVGCIGPCYLEPLVDIQMPGLPRVSYANVTSQKIEKIIKSVILEADLLPNWALGHFGDDLFTKKTGILRFFDHPMLKSQVRVILRNCGFIDPENIDHYLAHDGYVGFVNALSKDPVEVISEVKDAGLRGRGGAGFSTYKKWEICRQAEGKDKIVICNADEGDPGAFMNRSLIEGDPHAVLEGILIAGYAVNANQGYVYVRAEYPLAVIHLSKAIHQMRETGLLGRNILGSGFSFNIEVKEGAGAFVCGEETALIASLEGERGMPRPRPPYPAESGLHGKPTLINNTETFGTLPNILRNGGKWLQQFGTKGNTGTKTFSLVGKVRQTGLIEVPLGTTLRQIVFDIGGGTEKPFKAVQTGGPLGGCLSAAHLDTPVDYENMRISGSIMGSGGLIVIDTDTCIVDLAKYFLSFSRRESCGKCNSCRIGTRILADTLEKITIGDGEQHDLDILKSVADSMQKTALCGGGQTAPNPILTTLRYFLQEYEAHIHEKYCPAGVCPNLFEYHIDELLCTGCTRCIKVCPSGAIQGILKEKHTLNIEKCNKCHMCYETCKFDAIIIKEVSQQSTRETFAELTL
jgi:NADH-quinone oxidoreductase subunit F